MSAKDLEDTSSTLKGANAENENLPHEDLLNTHNAEENSKDTTENNSWKKKQEHGNETRTLCDPTIMKCFSFKNKPKCYIQESLIPTVNYSFKYIPFFCATEYLTASTDDKVRLLEEYHAKLSNQRAKLYSKSFVLAPLPPPIQLYSPSNNTHESNVNEVDSVENTYISRSGRCTKRKNYNETLTLRSTKEIKSEDNADEEWSIDNPPGNKNMRKRRKNGTETTKASPEKSIKRQKNELETSTVSGNEETELDTSSPTATEKKNDPKSENQTTKRFITRKNSRKFAAESNENNASLSKGEDEDYEVCPICSKTFLVDEIETHASSCGEMR